MKANKGSITAKGVAFARALESSKPESERLFEDRFATRLMNRNLYWFFRLIKGQMERRMPGVFSFLILRTRYIDDLIQRMVIDGIKQLVILGAGLDSRAYRIEGLSENVRVFEVDHPATQERKLANLKKIMKKLPSHITYVPIDFDAESLAKLGDFGFDKNVKSLFVWEGVIYYLTADAVDSTLAFIMSNAAQGSAVIFDYIYSEALEAGNPNGPSRYQRGSRTNGESFNYGIPTGQLKSFLSKRGFSSITDLSADDLVKTYFTPRNRKEKVAQFYGIAVGTV